MESLSFSLDSYTCRGTFESKPMIPMQDPAVVEAIARKRLREAERNREVEHAAGCRATRQSIQWVLRAVLPAPAILVVFLFAAITNDPFPIYLFVVPYPVPAWIAWCTFKLRGAQPPTPSLVGRCVKWFGQYVGLVLLNFALLSVLWTICGKLFHLFGLFEPEKSALSAPSRSAAQAGFDATPIARHG
jgi:hypothetical protein